jgi:hypothetical protein
MPQYYDGRTMTRFIEEKLEEVSDPRHRAILHNYRRHGLFEVMGQWERIFTPDLTVEHPVYHLNVGGRSTVLDGREAVAAHYESIRQDGGAPLMGPIDQRIAVADWGLGMHSFFGHQLTAQAAAKRGFGDRVDDPDAHYYLTCWYAEIWRYDESCLLIGEHIFQDPASATFWKMDPSDVVPLEEAYDRIRPLLEEELGRPSPLALVGGAA